MNDMGVIVNSHTVKLERRLPHSIEEVWHYFSDEKRISEWLMPCTMDAEEGGLVELISEPIPDGVVENVEQDPHESAIRGLIRSFEPPELLEFSWYVPSYNSATEFRVELKSDGDETVLVLVHSHLEAEFMAAVAAGWHTHLETVAAMLRGEEKPEFMPRFTQLLEEYKTLIAGAGIVVVATTASAAPAAAADLSDRAYKEIRAERQHLLGKYDRLWRDAKDIKFDIRRLEKASNVDRKAIDSLHRDLKYKKQDMKKLELDIRDLDKVLH